ncbi:RagB/SusD family nutrient uptake outer membrane protein [Mucilaginibacter sp. UR6-11]|uniref:RagB/SusD family nutrient uptake outer membrane protein n=1 Tax=Mucilaginibacter sp. UR6-11 TaxID=1435644 RepID=UPI001E4C89FB|nr:RagB/SusD family nutrient uptake outer membrane protein [Mucilaginibacter sp. UR6-11]MCC8424883.1 RagB/SusD family nutrient uptake outer membrane protein [Mucilaginibacter sp. UR6-11]
MKKIIICLLLVAIASQYSCKKFLDITPIDKLTGNNYYQSASDVETNITDMYGQLFDKYVQTNTAGATGEFRSGEVVPTSNQSGDRKLRYDVALLGGHTRHVDFSGTTTGFQTIATTAVNDRLLLNALLPNYNGIPNTYNFVNLTRWNEYYRVIQSANILVSKLTDGIPSLSADQTKRYLEEAKFIRCFCYFFMVRLYGDVVYYTTAYQKDPLPRTNMVSVVNQCIADLLPGKEDLPPSITDPSLRGVRASKGAVIGLLMNMNMWNAGFDPAKKASYYQSTIDLGEELKASNAFRLLPLSEWNTVTKGRSEESLFELFTTVNYGSQIFSLAQFGESFIHFPYRLPEYNNRTSPCVFTADYMKKLFPDPQDGRLSTWFDDAFNQNAETFQCKKFAGNTYIDASQPLNNAIPDATFLIMRYADAILLRAEAYAQLGKDTEAAAALNEVRNFRGASPYPSSFDTNSLKDVIFYERAKELIGEGSHYFDLVRTKRILSKQYTDNPLTSDKFGRGGWTWPIDQSALTNNPYMTLNAYWRGTGIE